jgi:hypothetical protein
MHGVVDGRLLVGRDPELSLIASHLADREHGTAIVVLGAPGIGKTALVEEAIRLTSPGRPADPTDVRQRAGDRPVHGRALSAAPAAAAVGQADPRA